MKLQDRMGQQIVILGEAQTTDTDPKRKSLCFATIVSNDFINLPNDL